MSENSVSVPQERILTPGRRAFLKGMLGVGAVLVLDGWRAIEANDHTASEVLESTPNLIKSATRDTQPNQKRVEGDKDKLALPTNPLARPLQSFDNTIKANQSISDTAVDSLAVTAGIMGYTIFANSPHVRLYSGNSDIKGIREKYRNDKLKSIATLVGVAPVAEEILFRGIPAIGGPRASLMPFRGMLSTYVFGKLHQIKTKEEEPMVEERVPGLLVVKAGPNNKAKPEADKNKIPVPQYAMGTYLWMVARRNGLAHSMIAHATTNAVATGFLEIGSHTGNKTSPSETIGE